MSTKRIAIFADSHCGHVSGLTPPTWEGDGGSKIAQKLAPWRRELWAEYLKLCKRLAPVHCVLGLGDLIDGRGEKSGSSEVLEMDRRQQAEMAIQAIQQLRPTSKTQPYALVYGTPYHAGQLEDWEDHVADSLGARIGNHLWPVINGVTFDIKHKIGSSSIPHGKGTPLMKDMLWNLLWSNAGEQPKAKVFVRAHTHSHIVISDPDLGIAAIAPSLQGWTKFGGRQVSKRVHFGVMVFDVTENKEVSWTAHLLRLHTAAKSPFEM